jgi:hypothetical protein
MAALGPTFANSVPSTNERDHLTPWECALLSVICVCVTVLVIVLRIAG